MPQRCISVRLKIDWVWSEMPMVSTVYGCENQTQAGLVRDPKCLNGVSVWESKTAWQARDSNCLNGVSVWESNTGWDGESSQRPQRCIGVGIKNRLGWSEIPMASTLYRCWNQKQPGRPEILMISTVYQCENQTKAYRSKITNASTVYRCGHQTQTGLVRNSKGLNGALV